MTPFQFVTATEIRFGAGVAKSIPGLLAEYERPLLIVTGSNPSRHKGLFDLISRNGYEYEIFSVGSEPNTEIVNRGTKLARETQVACVVAIGGGSVLDTGKAIAALATNPGNLLDYLEVVGKGKPLAERPIPFMAVPTTSGTGTEVTKNSVIEVPEAGVKVSLRSDSMLARWAVVDPELTYQLPSEVAAYSGMDALIQNLEAYLCRQANPVSDGLAREGLKLASRSLLRACGKPLDPEAKADMSAASLCSGMAFANAKLGSVHGFAGPLGGMIDAPHGEICASLLIPCLRANLRALSTRAPQHPSLEKMSDIARLLTGNPEAKPSYAVAWLQSLFDKLPLRRLGKLGLREDRVEEAAEKAARASSMKGNSIELSRFELIEILEEAL